MSVNRPRREADESPQSGDEVDKKLICISILAIAFTARCPIYYEPVKFTLLEASYHNIQTDYSSVIP